METKIWIMKVVSSIGIIPKKYKKIQNFDINQLTNLDNDRETYLDHNIFSIDSKETKDIDDAVSIKQNNDLITLYIHIADASYFAMRDKNIFKNASENISSFYFPHKKVNMIPEILSENYCSLNEGEKRFAFTTIIDLDKNYKVISSRINKSIIKNNHKLTYIDVDKILLNKKTCSDKLKKDINLLNKVTEKIGSSFNLSPSEDNSYDKNEKISRRMIEIIMGVNNIIVASLLSKRVPKSVLRIQNNEYIPNNEISKKINNEEVKKVLKYLKYSKSYYAIRKNLKDEDINHESLGVKYYTHFTSPIRRFVDLWNHICLKRIIKNKKLEEIEENFNYQINNQINIINLKHYYYKQAYKQIELVNIFHNENINKENNEGVVIEIEKNSITVYLTKIKSIIHLKLINKELSNILDGEIKNDRLHIKNINNGSEFIIDKYQTVNVKIFKNSSRIKWKDKIIFQLTSPNYSEWLL